MRISVHIDTVINKLKERLNVIQNQLDELSPADFESAHQFMSAYEGLRKQKELLISLIADFNTMKEGER